MPADNHLQFNSLETFIIANCPLTGSIPNWLQSCANLQFLDLSWNLLTGHIPYFFSEMRLLFYLDLSRNMLSEEIPEGLAKLKSLYNQNITNKKHSQDLNNPLIRIWNYLNNLSGNIPTGGQFTTFPSSSFEGNDDLSGYESSLDPSESKGKTRKNLAGTGDREDSIIGLPFVIGSIIAFVIVVTIGHLSGWLFPKEKANKRIEIAWRRTR
ncbi:hypothetical protein POM88_049018 [Heracleum sosnowskyi]|uniref:Uncharacterized protein n=1 Tax=Heracleum sosnowskyi TaxID=360622 RepID=A0AAD8GW75_9APIA|nr:hypothetical protein POM88_049017 [Heracleum sosnowskyi]KAK1355762.1 hypothetical protein POM88_049018 [Heracleum sosnowskyi]